MSMKYCKDCKHFWDVGGNLLCKVFVSRVTGDVAARECYWHRYPSQHEVMQPDICGPEAKFFEAKDATALD